MNRWHDKHWGSVLIDESTIRRDVLARVRLYAGLRYSAGVGVFDERIGVFNTPEDAKAAIEAHLAKGDA
jgi:hypothetical protein